MKLINELLMFILMISVFIIICYSFMVHSFHKALTSMTMNSLRKELSNNCLLYTSDAADD